MSIEMLKLKVLITCILLVFLMPFGVSTQADTGIESDLATSDSIRLLMKKTGAGNMGVQAMNQLLPTLKTLVPDAPEKFWQDFMAEVDADELIELVVPIYQKYLSQQDIDAINTFYDTPAGKNLIKQQPLIMQASMLAGQQWGKSLAQKVIEKYQTEREQAEALNEKSKKESQLSE